ncbi:MAG: hypothetical protein ACXVA4_04270 [Ktedonobacterales bacterium]
MAHEWLPVDEDFDAADGKLDARWKQIVPGGGRLEVARSSLRLVLPGARQGGYSDAQIDDYSGTGAGSSRFSWRPPLRMEVRARASHPAHPTHVSADVSQEQGLATEQGEQQYLRGTVGFGFWNYPFTLSGAVVRLPDAIWFFAASPPSNMALVPGLPGWGWKAQVVHAHRWQALAAGVPALGAVAWARLSGQEDAAARWVQRVSGAKEATLDTTGLHEWHDYTLEWRREEARFWVDGALVLAVPEPPPGPLGFVAWIDNQYAVATPRGAFRFGTLDSATEWLEIDWLRITPL